LWNFPEKPETGKPNLKFPPQEAAKKLGKFGTQKLNHERAGKAATDGALHQASVRL
jgi:hypothetical protein